MREILIFIAALVIIGVCLRVVYVLLKEFLEDFDGRN